MNKGVLIKMKKKRVLFISSTGGHFNELQQLQPLFEISLFHWLLFLIISGIGFAFIQVTYMRSIGVIGALKTSFFLSLNPIITYIESLLFLNEKFDIIHFIGFVILAIAIYMMNGQKEKRTNSLSRSDE